MDEPKHLVVSQQETDQGGVVVAISGEIDMETAPIAWQSIVEALANCDGRVVVDLSEVSFIDSQGINALLRVYRDCGIDDGRLAVRSPQSQARKVFEITGLDKIIPIDPPR
jgi:anti-sigma B factor antagonist